MRALVVGLRIFLLTILLAGTWLRAEVISFDLPSRPAADALLEFSKQAGVEVLFSATEVRGKTSYTVRDTLDPQTALNRLLTGTDLTARRNFRGKFVITPTPPAPGTITGRVVDSRGLPVSQALVRIAKSRLRTQSNEAGDFTLNGVPPGTHSLNISARTYVETTIADVAVESHQNSPVTVPALRREDELLQLDPYIVAGSGDRSRSLDRSGYAPRTAAGNLDLPRTRNDALPFEIYTREQLTRSGVVNLNDFLQRELLDAATTSRPPEQNGSSESYLASSLNLNLRGFGAESTVVLLNGRRLPEVINIYSGPRPPDVNVIPLGMIERVEILPVSASALYSGNPVGGAINIVLRRDVEATELTSTFSNTTRGFDAPQYSVSLQHGQNLLGGRLRLRLSATYTKVTPPTEPELGYRRNNPATQTAPLDVPVYRATPNVRSVGGTPLFANSDATVTSVAPGANGNGGLAAFNGRAGLRNFDFFDTGGAMAASINSQQYPYGRLQERSTYFASATYDAFPWLEIGIDALHSLTRVNRGFDLVTADLDLSATSPFNPFGQDVKVSLNEFSPLLGENYSEARLESTAAVLGVLLKLPGDWRIHLDTQYARSLTRYRGLVGANLERWQALVDQGIYNPLRDTQVMAAPAEFYNGVLVHRGAPHQFTKIGDYNVLDAAFRLTNQSLHFPTGVGALNLGADYRRSELLPDTEYARFGDGTLAQPPVEWLGRVLQRYSIFGEMQAPMLPARLLPRWARALEADMALRYVAADTSAETNLAPALGFKLELTSGFSFRGSVTLSSGFPPPNLSRQGESNDPDNGGVDLKRIFDPRRNEAYDVVANEPDNPALTAEEAVTQTAGVIYQRGQVHRFRASLDFIDTIKTNELVSLDPQTVVNLESLFPERVSRSPAGPGDPGNVGRITRLLTGSVNAAERHSQNWSTSLEYAWSECLGGTLELRTRWLYFQTYDLQLFSNAPTVDELGAPDGAAPGVLRHRVNLGASWANRKFGFGTDVYYFHHRLLPEIEQPVQGRRDVKAYTQVDLFLHKDLTEFLPWKTSRFALRGQIRVNNVFDFDYPKYVNDASGAGVQAYGDFRGRTYSLSLSASF